MPFVTSTLDVVKQLFLYQVICCHLASPAQWLYLGPTFAWGPDSDPDYVDCSSESLICSTKGKLYRHAPSGITQNPGDQPGEVFAL